MTDVEPDPEAVWRVCHVMTGFCLRCLPHEKMGEDEDCTRGCYLQAVECINVVQTGNPWRKTEGVRRPWTVLGGGHGP